MSRIKAVGRLIGGIPLSMIIDNVQNIAATEEAKHFESTLDAVERQVHERRKQQRNY